MIPMQLSILHHMSLDEADHTPKIIKEIITTHKNQQHVRYIRKFTGVILEVNEKLK